MPEMIPHSFERAAFLGGYGERGKAAKVDVVAKKIDKVLKVKPIDDPTRRKITDGAREAVVGLGNGVESVGELQDILNDPNKTETQKRNADHSLDILSKGAFIAMQYGGNQELVDLLGRGSVAEIEARLPEPLKGLGERILGNIIDDENILTELRLLDKRKERAATVTGTAGDRALAEAIDKSLGRFIEMDGVSEDQLKMVMAYLGTQRLELDEKINGGTRVDRPGTTVDTDGGVQEGVAPVAPTRAEVSLEEAVRQLRRIATSVQPDVDSRERREGGVITLAQIKQYIKEIEGSGKDTADLTLNANKFRILMDVTLGKYRIEGMGRLPRAEVERRIVQLNREIKMRLFLNDFYLLASKTHDIEGIGKLMVAMHEGDDESVLDKELISFMLNDGANGLPVDLAWDLRQEGYFNYGGVDKRNGRAVPPNGGEGLLNRIARERPDLVEKYDRLAPPNKRGKFLEVGVLLNRNEEYGIHQDYFTNLRNDLDQVRKDIVKEYTIDRIKAEQGNGCTTEDAERAHELARRLSVVTYQDSAANLAMASGDDYAELVLFKFLRYQDGVEVSFDDEARPKPAKNKPVGSLETIKFIDTLSPPWLSTVSRKGSTGLGMCRPLRAHDIDASRIGGKSDMAYHFNSIIFKKAQKAKEALMSAPDPKVSLTPDEMQKTYERLTKVVSEARAAGWSVMDPEYFRSKPELSSTENLIREQRFLRFVYVMGVLERATKSDSFGWSREVYDKFEKLLMRSEFFTSEDGTLDGSFISKNQLQWIQGAYRPRQIFGLFDEAERAKRRRFIK